VVVEKATGKKVREAAALTVMIEDMRTDLGRMSAREFHNRHLDV